MVVRFLPVGSEQQACSTPDRDDLAEVIELRTRLTADRTESQPGEARAEQARTALTAIEEVVTHSAEALASEPGDAASDVEVAAVRLLARRARSSGELRRELLSHGHAAADVESVILQCESNLYLDDLGLARVLTEGLRERKRASRSQIRMKLRERLLPDGVIEEVVGELDDDEEHELLRQAANARASKMTGLDRTTAERRLLGFLARRGWSGERAARVAREALDNTAARGTVRFR